MKTTPTSCVYLAVAALISVILNPRVEAAPQYINGSISFQGNASLNGSTSSATAINSFTNINVLMATNGDYAPLENSRAAILTPFSFNPSQIPLTPLWTCASNGITYSFDASSMAVVFTSGNFVAIQGTGIAHVTGYADTPGIWTVSVGAIGPSVTFTASTMVSATNVPTINSYTMSNGNIGMSWNALPGQPYQLQTAPNADELVWSNVVDVITTTNSTATTSYPIGGESSRLFRVVVLPQ
jgi:hypothetical protein